MPCHECNTQKRRCCVKLSHMCNVVNSLYRLVSKNVYQIVFEYKTQISVTLASPVREKHKTVLLQIYK